MALRFHAEVLRALPGIRAIWQCEPILLQDREHVVTNIRKSGQLIASASRHSLSGTSCHTIRLLAWTVYATSLTTLLHTHRDVGALFQPGTAISDCVRPAVPPLMMPRPDARNLLSMRAPALIAASDSGGRVGGGLAAITPHVDPLDHNSRCISTRKG